MEGSDITKFLNIVIAIQLALWGLVGLNILGFKLFFFQQIIGFIFLIFIPGIIILKILKIHKNDTIQMLLYAIGLSLAFNMILGLIINLLYPFFGIVKPLSIIPMIITWSFVLAIFSLIAYKNDDKFFISTKINYQKLLNPKVLFFVLLPIWTILGAQLVNFYQNSILLLLLLITLSIIPILIILNYISEELYPLAIFSTAISLLFHNSLISMFIVEWADASWEYSAANTSFINSIWNPTTYSQINGMLSITTLGPVFANFCNIGMVWVFKIIYPLIFALVPLVIYYIVRLQTSSKIAFLSSFFFMSVFTFFITSLGLARQQIAMFFLVLLFLALVDNNIKKIQKIILFVIFSFSIVVSHYGLASVFLIMLIVTSLVLTFFSFYNRHYRKQYSLIKPIFIILYIIFLITWYVYIADATIFNSLIRIGTTILSNLNSSFLNPESTAGLDLLIRGPKLIINLIYKLFYLATSFFITIGILQILFKRENNKFNIEYLAFSVSAFGILLAVLIVPYFTAIDTSRLLHIALLFLTPFCVIGAIIFFNKLLAFIKILTKIKWLNKNGKLDVTLVSIFFAIFLLFNSGVIHQISGNPTSFSLNSTGINTPPHFNNQEISGAKWSDNYINESKELRSDLYNAHLFMMITGKFSPLIGNRDIITPILHGDYIYLGSENIIVNIIRLSFPTNIREGNILNFKNISLYNFLLNGNSNKIFDNRESQIYYAP